MASRVDALKRYREKRDFTITPEPADSDEAGSGEGELSFVIQKHWASHLHYDFRLELDGSMKSWAVPKGPSLDTKIKRMAVQVEDHPIAYSSFEGEIPAKQYGAGKVIIWDRGTWTPVGDPQQGYRDGNLKFILHGEKLQGKWALIRMKGNEEKQPPWLLIKEKDAYVRADAEYRVTDAFPDSVVSKPQSDAEPTAAPAGAAPVKTTNAAKAGKAAKATKPVKAVEVTKAAEAPVARATVKTTKAPTQTSKSKTGSAKPPKTPALPALAVPAPLPATLAPELATLVTAAPSDDDTWLYEIKFDGYRILARIDADTVCLLTRNGNDWSAKMPHLVKAIEALHLQPGWLDGEIVALNSAGMPDFQALQNAFDGAATQQLVYYVFDLPYYAGHDLRAAPLQQRRALLQTLIPDEAGAAVRFSQAFELPVADLLASSCQLGMEGVIGKRKQSSYVCRRSDDWIKLKCGQRQEFVIGGYTDPKGTRSGFGALLLGVHDADGRLQYAGNVGTGFNENSLGDLHRRLQALATDKSAFQGKTGIDRSAHWVEPELVAEVAFSGWTTAARLRHAVFHALRTDKPAREIIREKPVPPPADDEDADDAGDAPSDIASAIHKASTAAGKAAASEAPAARRVGSAAATKVAKTSKTAGAIKAAKPSKTAASSGASRTTSPGRIANPPSVKVTHPERIIDAASHKTKGELVAYYTSVAPLMMAHLEKRPVALVRAPDGVDGELFFQKHAEHFSLEGVALLDRAFDPGHAPLLVIEQPVGLQSAAQMNVIEFHTWNALSTAIELPDRMTFDLDPGADVAWQTVRECAQLVRAFLEQLGLTSFLKTSGGKGLHVVVPLRPQYDWDTVKDFSHAIVTHLAQTIPKRFVAKSGPANRIGKVFVDYLRNGRGATTACAWSVRARPGLGISVPVGWDELDALSGGAHWTIDTTAERLDVGNTPWDGYAAAAQSPDEAMRRLGYTVPKTPRKP